MDIAHELIMLRDAITPRGPLCRDCADTDVFGVCKNDGHPCDPTARAIEIVARMRRALARAVETLEIAASYASDTRATVGVKLHAKQSKQALDAIAMLLGTGTDTTAHHVTYPEHVIHYDCPVVVDKATRAADASNDPGVEYSHPRMGLIARLSDEAGVRLTYRCQACAVITQLFYPPVQDDERDDEIVTLRNWLSWAVSDLHGVVKELDLSERKREMLKKGMRDLPGMYGRDAEMLDELAHRFAVELKLQQPEDQGGHPFPHGVHSLLYTLVDMIKRCRRDHVDPDVPRKTWSCATCGATFPHHPMSEAAMEGVTRCSTCAMAAMFRDELVKYRVRLRDALYRLGVHSNPAVTDDWILDRVDEATRR